MRIRICERGLSAEGIIKPETSYKGKAKEQECEGEIYFVLLSENGLDVLPDREFSLRGSGIDLSGKTDGKGEFKHSPAAFRDYELKVADGVFCIPAVYKGSLPYQVYVPYVMFPDQCEWDGPTEEELGGVKWDVVKKEDFGQ